MSVNPVFSAYANQDWGEEFESLEEMVTAFVLNENRSEVVQTIGMLEGIAKQPPEVTEALLRDLGCYLGPVVGGDTASTLRAVIEILSRQLKAKAEI